MPKVSAAEDPTLANDMITAVLQEMEDSQVEEEQEPIDIIEPPENTFRLPGGYVAPGIDPQYEIEVKELTGRDEEAIARAKNFPTMLETILQRGLVRVGDQDATKDVLASMLAGDRDFALLKIFSITFGADVTATRVCQACGEEVSIEIDVDSDVPVRELDDINDAFFTVDCSRGRTANVMLPTGVTQKEIQDNSTKSYSELTTTLLENTVREFDGRPILSKQDVLDLPVRDRRLIAEEIARRAPGPRMQDVVKECPNCENPMEVPLSMAVLFQF